MNIALVDVDNTNKVSFPNLVLMKLSTYYKKEGHNVKLIHGNLLNQYDKESKMTPGELGPVTSEFFPDHVCKSKVFTWTKDKNIRYKYSFHFGGTGSPDITLKLPIINGYDIDQEYPDYDLYKGLYRQKSQKFENAGIGFTTRGCPNKCSFCFVPKKEGLIRPYMKIEQFKNSNSNKLILLDNNILAHKHGIREIEKMKEQKLEVDFNQGLEATIIVRKEYLAKLLSELKYLTAIRLACDSQKEKEPLEKAVKLLKKYHCPGRLFAYTIILPDVEESYDRIKYVDSLGVIPYAQSLRDVENTPPNIYMKALQRWVSSAVGGGFFTFSFEDYINIILTYDPKNHKWKERLNRNIITKEWKKQHPEKHWGREMNLKKTVKEIVDEKMKKDSLHSEIDML